MLPRPNRVMHHALSLSLLASLAPIGDDPPPGPPWKRSYREACLDAIQNGRPVFVYFSKTY